MEKITVEITHSELLKWPSGGFEAVAIAKLKKAGIPIRGALVFGGVESGTLIKDEDFRTKRIIYTWRP